MCDSCEKCIPDCGECPPIRDITLKSCTIAGTSVIIYPLLPEEFNGFITQFPIQTSQGGSVDTYPLSKGAVVYTPPQLDPECQAPFIGCDSFAYSGLDNKCRKVYFRVFVEIRSDLLSSNVCGKVYLNDEIVPNIQAVLSGPGKSDPLFTISSDLIDLETDSNYCLGLLFPGTYTVTLIKPPGNIQAVESENYEIDSDGNIVFSVCALEGLINLPDAFFVNL